MMKRPLLLALALALPGASFAATPPAKAPAKAAGTPATTTFTFKRVPMSKEGIAKVTELSAVPDPRIQQIATEEQSLLRQKAQFLSGAPIDMAKLEAVLRREVELLSELQTRRNERLLTIMRALSDSDRVALLQTAAVQNKAASQGSSPAPATNGR
jgi:hypothetical protein